MAVEGGACDRGLGDEALDAHGADALGVEQAGRGAQEPVLGVEVLGDRHLPMPEHFRDVIAGGLPEATTNVLAVTQRPVLQKALTAELSGQPAWRTLPSWTLIATQDNAIPAQAQEFMAERAGSHVVRVQASHSPSISQPDAVADLIMEAAEARQGLPLE
ncbi:alpha/beta hydrolase [Nonomuraea sp. NPDC050022]|uniref:alpha/beta hydrolase n=1 Tax=unclassified Nonomuraea TaxID=2593643 RepID=UPI0033ED1252